MAKLCIILSSIYQNDYPSFFNAEVQKDLSIVRETLQEYSFLEINIPSEAASVRCKKIICQALKLIDIDAATDCHIVLNTHGIPGYSDLRHDSIIYLVDTLSFMQANIIQISGLQCDGMKKLNILNTSGNIYKISMSNVETKRIYRDANLHALQKKLSRLILAKEQSFKIYGFEDAYDPFQSESDVREVLTGQSVNQIHVTIHSWSITAEYARQIEEKITLLREYQKLTPEAYQKLANFFAIIQKNMKQLLLISLEKNLEIGSESPLWQLNEALKTHAQNFLPHLDQHNPHHMNVIYKNWLKTYKLYAENRIDVIRYFAQVALEHSSKQISNSAALSSKI
jgi:hypothetical protein